MVVEFGGELFDLVDDGGGGVVGVVEWYVCVGLDGVDVVDWVGWVGEVLLFDEYEWLLYYCVLGVLMFGVCDFCEGFV